MKYTDEQRLDRICEITDKLIAFLQDKGITDELIFEDESVRWTITTPLYNIGEHVYYLSNDFKAEYSDVPWAKISGLRHRLVHDYEGTDWSIINEILFSVLPNFKKQIDDIIKSK